MGLTENATKKGTNSAKVVLTFPKVVVIGVPSLVMPLKILIKLQEINSQRTVK